MDLGPFPSSSHHSWSCIPYLLFFSINLLAQAYKAMGRIDLYGLNAPTCLYNEASDTSLPPSIPTAGNPDFDPCGDYRIWWYMNRPDVQQAFNVLAPGQKAGQWNSCGESVNISYSALSIAATVSHLYPTLMSSGIEVFLVSGNDDGYVPTLGTRSWIGALKSLEVLPIKISSSPGPEDQIPGSEDQIPWINNQTGRVGGFVTRYRLKSKRGANFDLAVIMNAGHQPPYFQPAGVAQLVSAWVGRVVSGKVAKR